VATKKTATKKSTTEGSATDRSASKKSAAKESAAKRPPAKKSTAKSSGDAPRAAAPRRRSSGIQLARAAAQQLVEMTGRETEGVTALERTDDGWKAEIEVLEVRRIPDTTDLLALYEVELDSDGDIEGYRRLRRYTRGESARGER
jgi:hypothetical protein